MIYVARDKKAPHNGDALYVMYAGAKPVMRDGYWWAEPSQTNRWFLGVEKIAESLGVHLEPGEIREVKIEVVP